jgi:pimeloyl-ACP methyl ester carboxylesterase
MRKHKMPNHSAYKSKNVKIKALKSYDDILTQWPVPYREFWVDTTFGKTYILNCGSNQNPPLVLLHGGGGNATMWMHNIKELSQHFCVYVLDIIGEAGKSDYIRLSYQSDEYSRWLNEVFYQIKLDKATICGASLGGMLAHQFAILFPERINSLILLAPPSILPMRLSFLIRAILANALKTKCCAKNFLKYISAQYRDLSTADITGFTIQFQAYKPNLDKIPVISNEELLKLPFKTLVLFGENEVIYNTKEAVEKIHKAAPNIKVAIIPNAKHTLSIDNPRLINEKIIQFAI